MPVLLAWAGAPALLPLTATASADRDGCALALRPLLRIPTLAIHLDRSVNTDGFKFNLEKELLPIFGLRDASSDPKNTDERLPSQLLKLLAGQLECQRAGGRRVDAPVAAHGLLLHRG